MWDPKLIDSIAQAVVARVLPAIKNGNGGGGHARLMSTKEAARYLGRSVSSLQHLRFRNEIPYVKRGRRIHYDREALDSWIRDDST